MEFSQIMFLDLGRALNCFVRFLFLQEDSRHKACPQPGELAALCQTHDLPCVRSLPDRIIDPIIQQPGPQQKHEMSNQIAAEEERDPCLGTGETLKTFPQPSRPEGIL